MASPLAKISMPSVRHVLTRRRLFRRLDGASHQPIVWVSGSAGVGKTTLVASYVVARKLRCVWYHVDAGDADLASFFFYLSDAATRGRRGRRARLPLLTHGFHGSEAAFARRFFRELVSLVGPGVLVFDDVMEAGADSAACRALRDGLEELTGGTRAILVSREEPPAALARLIAGGTMACLSGRDLRLGRAEALAIARTHAPPGTTDAELSRACERADGWAAGVVLLASGAGPSGHVQPTRAAFDYLASEVFEHASREVRDVLLDAAVVAPIPERLADRVCGAEGAGAILADLARRAYFTSRRDGAEPTFVLHPLFRDFLLARGRAERTPDELRRLRSRAGALLAEEGHAEHAMALLVDAQCWADAARLAQAQAPSLVATGRSATLARWLTSVPREERDRDPWNAYWLGTCRFGFDATEARALFERAYAGFEGAGDVAGLYAACIGALEAIIVEWADLREMDRWLERLEALRARGIEVPSRDLDARRTVAVFGAMTFHLNDSPELLDWEERARAIVRDESAPAALRLALGSWYLIECTFRGEIVRSHEAVDALAGVARARGIDPAPAIGWLCGEAVHHWHAGAAGAAAAAVDVALELARDTGVHAWDYLLHLQRVNAALAADDLTSARASLATAARAVDASRPLNLAVLEHERGLVALRAGEIDVARECARATERLGAGSGLPFAVLIARLKLALAATLEGAADARPELDRAREVGRRMRSSLAELVCELCEAALSLRAGDEESARRHVGRGLRVVREKGVAPDVWFSREQLSQLCAVALGGGVEAECARALVRRLGLAAPAASAHLDAWPWPARVRLLGVLEAEVDDRRLRFRGRSQRRPLEVLGAIAAFGGEGVAEHAVEDALWPDSEGAHHALETSLYRLRRMLGGAIVAHRDRLLTLDRQRCWVDTIAFEAALGSVSSKLERRDLADALRAAERAIRVYRGPFLADSEEPWVLAARSRLRRRWQRAVADLASHGVEPGRLHDLCARAMILDPALDPARSGGSHVAV